MTQGAMTERTEMDVLLSVSFLFLLSGALFPPFLPVPSGIPFIEF